MLSFVGATVVADNVNPLTITAGDLHGSATTGDFMLVAVSAALFTGGDIDTSALGWTRGLGDTGAEFSPGIIYAVAGFAGVVGNAALPAEFDFSSWYGYSRAVIAVFRPSADIAATGRGSALRHATSGPVWDPGGPTSANETVAIASTFTNGIWETSRLTSLTGSSGWADAATIDWPPWAEVGGIGAGNVKVATGDVGRTASLPAWNRDNTGVYAPIVGVAWAVEAATPASGWHIGSLRFGSTGPGW